MAWDSYRQQNQIGWHGKVRGYGLKGQYRRSGCRRSPGWRYVFYDYSDGIVAKASYKAIILTSSVPSSSSLILFSEPVSCSCFCPSLARSQPESGVQIASATTRPFFVLAKLHISVFNDSRLVARGFRIHTPIVASTHGHRLVF